MQDRKIEISMIDFEGQEIHFTGLIAFRKFLVQERDYWKSAFDIVTNANKNPDRIIQFHENFAVALTKIDALNERYSDIENSGFDTELRNIF